LEIRDQLFRLVRIQEIAQETRAARALVDGAPARIEQIEGHFRERNAEYVAVKQRFDALEDDQRTRSSELAALEESKKKYMDDLMQVQNQREYAAMLKEIDSVKSDISEHEDAIIKDMEEIETVKTELATHEEHIKTERVQVGKERTEVEASVTQARETIIGLDRERSGIESELPASLVANIRRIEAGRQGLFMSKADDGVCQSCFVRVRPQGFQEVKLALKIHYCSNCKRLMFHEPSLKRMAAAQSGDEASPGSGTDQIEAVDGGAI
jgi:predicted  nucleic acid-binding Zn-ribbon protein